MLCAVEDVHRGGSPMDSRIARKVVQFFRQTPASAPENGALSPREEEVLGLLARGYLFKEIAAKLSVSVPTVNTYVRRVYEKLHVRSRGQAIAKYAHITGAEDGPRRAAGQTHATSESRRTPLNIARIITLGTRNGSALRAL